MNKKTILNAFIALLVGVAWFIIMVSPWFLWVCGVWSMWGLTSYLIIIPLTIAFFIFLDGMGRAYYV